MAVTLRRKAKVDSLLPFAMSLAVVAAISCGSRAPSDELAKQTFEKLIRDEPGEFLAFKKTNGVASEAFGVKYYEYRYEATVRCKQEFTWYLKGVTEPPSCNAGDTAVIRGTITFRLTENGWEGGSP